MSLIDFLTQQFIDVLQWNEPEDGILAWRYPMRDMEIQNGGQLTVRDSQLAAFVDEGHIADVFTPGLHTLNTRNLPVLTDMLNWDKGFESPFKSDVYFFSTRQQLNQKWGTATPITFREKEFGAVSLRAYGIYAYRISDPRAFFTQVSGTRDTYYAADLSGQLRETIVSRIAELLASSEFSFLDMAAHQDALAQKVSDAVRPAFAALGLDLTQFVVESLSLPDELQKIMDQRIGINIAGDPSRLTQYQTAESIPVAAANPSGAAGVGVSFGAGLAMANLIAQTQAAMPKTAAAAEKSCTSCGHSIPAAAHFCPDCGKPQ